MSEARMPAIFFGHGSPMNAIEDTVFSRTWRELGRKLPRPRAVLCVSAHWLTGGSPATAMEKPRTIHDFGGFPRALYEVEYPAPGLPALAAEIAEALSPVPVRADQEWGLDHGTWSVLRHVFPDADVPIVQLGIDIGKPPAHHYELGRKLKALREKGVMVVGSGNIVHNLMKVDWERMDEDDYGFDWARAFDGKVRTLIEEKRDAEVVEYGKLGQEAALSIPTPDHYYPLLYVLGARDSDEEIEVFNAKAVAGSLTMTSYRFG